MISDYLELKIFNEFFAVYPRNQRLSKKLFRIYPLRGRQYLRNVLKILHLFKLDRIFLRTRNQDVLKEFGGKDFIFLEYLKQCHADTRTICFFYPSPKRSKNRFYGYALNTSGEPVAYIKIARNDDWLAVQNECAAVKKLDTLGTLPFQYPKCLGFSKFSDKSGAAIFSMLPETSQSLNWHDDIWGQEIKPLCDAFVKPRRSVSTDELANERWFCDFTNKIPKNSLFYKTFMATLDHGMEVSWVHGDFTGQNFYKNNNMIGVFDWEEMTENGPMLTDEIGFYLWFHRYHLSWSLDCVWNDFKNKYLETSFKNAAIQAIAFLYGRNIYMGNEIVNLFNNK